MADFERKCQQCGSITPCLREISDMQFVRQAPVAFWKRPYELRLIKPHSFFENRHKELHCEKHCYELPVMLF